MKIRQTPIRTLALVLMVLVAATGWTATNQLKNYDTWKDLPSKTLMWMGSHFIATEKYDSALVVYNIVSNRQYNIPASNNKTELKRIVSSMNELAVLYTNHFFDYQKAHQNLLNAEKIAKNNEFTDILGNVYSNLANLYLIQCSYQNGGIIDDKTLIYHKKAFQTSLEANDPLAILSVATNIAHIADSPKNMHFLRDDIENFLNWPIPDSLNNWEYVKEYCRASVLAANGKYERALQLYDNTYRNVYHPFPLNCKAIKSEILDNKLHIYTKLNRNQEAIGIINCFFKCGKEDNDHHLLFISYMLLSDYYETQKDSITGDRYELMAHREKDIVLNQNKLLDAEYTEFLFQLDEINAEVQELAYRQRMTKMIAWGIAALVLVVLAFLYLLWRRYRQEQEKNRILYEKNQALLSADEERRQRIITEQQAPRPHQLEESERSDLLHRVFFIMETNDEVYSPDFTLPRLAELVDDTRNNVSEAINQQYHTNFNGVLNEYRIKEACRRISDTEHYGHLTIEAIGQSVGFRSNSNFVSNFKKITGLTPSAYRKQSKPQYPTDSTD